MPMPQPWNRAGPVLLTSVAWDLTLGCGALARYANVVAPFDGSSWFPKGRKLVKRLVAMIFFAMLAGNAMAQAGGASSGAGGGAGASAAGASAGTIVAGGGGVGGGGAGNQKKKRTGAPQKGFKAENVQNPPGVSLSGVCF